MVAQNELCRAEGAVSKPVQLIAMFWGLFCGGLLTTVPGPAMPNIKEALGVSEGDLGLAFLGATALAVAGAALAPGLERGLGQSLAIGGALLLCAVSTALTLALSRLFLVFAALQALSLGSLSTAITLMISRVHTLWGEQVAAPLHFVSSGAGFGSLTVPVLVLPFALPPACLSNHTALPGLGELPLNNASSDNRTLQRPSICSDNLYILYAIIGCAGLPTVFVFLYIACMQRGKHSLLDDDQAKHYGSCAAKLSESLAATPPSADSKESLTMKAHSGETKNEKLTLRHEGTLEGDGAGQETLPATRPEPVGGHLTDKGGGHSARASQSSAILGEEGGMQPWRYRLLVLLMGLLNLVTIGAIVAFTNFLTSVGMELFALSQGTMGLMTSVVLASFTLSRVLSACLSVWVTPGTLVTGSLGGLLGAGLFLEGWGRRGEPALWVGAVIWSICIAPSFGGLFSWGQGHISMTTSVVAFLMVFDNGGLPALSAVVGGLVQWLGPHGLTVYALALPIYMIAVFIAMNIVLAIQQFSV